MTGAMYAAIGGLKAHMSKLNVIGNNVANVNTYGYKTQRMTFKESMYTTSRSGSNGGAATGGNNPSQVGYGASVGSIDLNMSPSTYAPTGFGLDCYIDGEGFFLMGDKVGTTGTGLRDGEEVRNLELSRVGDFWIDPDGYICNRDGKCVYGFAQVQNPEYKPNATEDEVKKNPNLGKPTIISTELVPLRVPLSAAAPTADQITQMANGTLPKWEEGDPVYPYLTTVAGKAAADTAVPPNAATSAGAVNAYSDPDQPVGTSNGKMQVARNDDPDAVSNVMPIQLDDFGISKNGAIMGIAENGDTVVIGYIAIASVDSPDGVTHIDGPYYRAMGGAGNVKVTALGLDLPNPYLGNKSPTGTGDAAGSALDRVGINTRTEIRDGGLEASSTDVAEEFSQMITTQRGYQANTRIITVTDSMLEELVNMKR